MRLIGLAISLEVLGMVVIIVAIIEGINQNPGMWLALLGGLLITCGGFLWNKVIRKR